MKSSISSLEGLPFSGRAATDMILIATSNPKFAFDEGIMDLTISYPIIYPQNSIVFSVDDPYYQSNSLKAGGLNNFLDAIDGSYCKLVPCSTAQLE